LAAADWRIAAAPESNASVQQPALALVWRLAPALASVRRQLWLADESVAQFEPHAPAQVPVSAQVLAGAWFASAASRTQSQLAWLAAWSP
jgi:hypothetical protein